MIGGYRIIPSIDGHSWKIEQSYRPPRGGLFLVPPPMRWTPVADGFASVEEAEAAIQRTVRETGFYYDSHGRPIRA